MNRSKLVRLAQSVTCIAVIIVAAVCAVSGRNAAAVVEKSNTSCSGGPVISLSDEDNDGLPYFVEIVTTKTDPCNADTDGDGNSDGREFSELKTNPLERG